MTKFNNLHSPLFFYIFMLLSFSVSAENQKIIIGNFSQQSAGIPGSWGSLTFPSVEKHTRYTLVTDEAMKVVKAESNQSASGITKNIRFNPKKYPYLSWQWKINKTITGTDVTTKSGDDYAARIYVVFKYDFDDLPEKEKSRVRLYKFFKGRLPPLATLNYIWGNKKQIGDIVPSPYTKRVKMFTLRNKYSETGKWHTEVRNIYEDYKQAFGEEPKEVISLAIMTDTDNTGSMAESFFGDISVSQMPPINTTATKKAQISAQ